MANFTANNDFEIRESYGLGRLHKSSAYDEVKTPQQKKHLLNNVWNNNAALSELRYYHTTPKESSSQQAHNTKDNFTWAGGPSPPRPSYPSKKCGKKHINAPWGDSNIRDVIATINVDQRNGERPILLGPKRGGNQGSQQVRQLLHHQIEKPSNINAKSTFTGKRGAGTSNATQALISADRDAKLSAAERNRITRSGLPSSNQKKRFYSSDPNNYFGFGSAVVEASPIGRAQYKTEVRGGQPSSVAKWSTPSTKTTKSALPGDR